MLGRVIGWLFLCLALLLAGGDIVRSLEAGAVGLARLGAVWSWLHAASLASAERALPGWAWTWVLEPLLRQPAMLIAAILGVLVLFLFRPSQRRTRATFR